jgi:hypothetical protein
MKEPGSPAGPSLRLSWILFFVTKRKGVLKENRTEVGVSTDALKMLGSSTPQVLENEVREAKNLWID